MKNNQILSFIIIIGILLFLGGGWYSIYKVHNSIKSKSISQRQVNKKIVPYFLIAVDVSGSMNENDKENYEAEALKNIIRAIYFNTINQFDKRFLPRIQIVTFSGKIDYITSHKEWEILNSVSDVLSLDRKIDKTLSERNGDYTDFNELINFILQANKNIKSENDVVLSSVILTDGVLYPDFFNEINHKSRYDFEKFKEGFGQNESKFAYNLKYGINDSEKMDYAKTELQEKFKRQLELQILIPIQLNIISLSKSGNEYLKRWTENLGELHIIKKSSDIGDAFLKIMSENLYIGYEKGFSNNGKISINPFTNDILAAELLTFNDNKTDTKFIDVKYSKLNENLKKTKILYFDEKMKGFHNPAGYSLNLNDPDKIEWLLITIHDNYLSFEQDKDNPFLFKLSLRRLKDNKNIKRNGFEIPLKVKMEISDKNLLRDAKIYPMDKEGYINFDFSKCNSGKYAIRFTIDKGKLKNDIGSLRKRSFVFSLVLNQNCIFFDENGKRLDKIIFPPVDRK